MIEPSTSASSAGLDEQVALVLAAEGLGRSHVMEQLLRFLLARAQTGRAPKEIEIAEAVFARSGGESDADSSVRVYVHRLRRKLDEFYAGPGKDQPSRLILPKGGYLLALEPLAMPEPTPPEPEPTSEPDPAPSGAPAAPRRKMWWLAVALLAPLVTLALGWQIGRWEDDPGHLGDIQKSALWQPLFAHSHRAAIVVGDYYIFGESRPEGEVARLIREFDVNSPRDLDTFKAMDEPNRRNYTDLGLSYLPLGVGAAIRSVAPLLRFGRNGMGVVTVVPTSRMDVGVLKSNGLVYLGYLSGLGSLREAVFDHSRFAVGASYDEIIDQRSGHHYMASSHLDNSNAEGEDYALISSFAGVDGNRIIIIAGTRDAALMQAADYVTRPETLAVLEGRIGKAKAFEALLGIHAMQNVGLEARLIEVSPRADPTWQKNADEHFPDQLGNSAVSAL